MLNFRSHFLLIFIFVLGILVGSLAMFFATWINVGRDIPQIPEVPVGSKTCQFQGKTYAPGESVKVDKCNSCTCENGQISCTTMVCE